MHGIPPADAFVGRKEMLELCEVVPGFGYAVDYGFASIEGMTVRVCRAKTHLSVANKANSMEEINTIYVGINRIADLSNIQLEEFVYIAPMRTIDDTYLLAANAITRGKE